MSASIWHVVETQRHREKVARAFLERGGIQSYLPRVVQWPRPAVGSAVAPMFPGYLFVHARAPDFDRVLRTNGVKGFVAFGGVPAAVDAAAIEFLRSREGPDGLIRCGEPSVADEVRIVGGPFSGLSGVVVQFVPARERVRVLLELLHRRTAVELPEKWVRLP